MNIITLVVIGTLGLILTTTIARIGMAIVKNIQMHHPHPNNLHSKA